jgi:hypothetical protein
LPKGTGQTVKIAVLTQGECKLLACYVEILVIVESIQNALYELAFMELGTMPIRLLKNWNVQFVISSLSRYGCFVEQCGLYGKIECTKSKPYGCWFQVVTTHELAFCLRVFICCSCLIQWTIIMFRVNLLFFWSWKSRTHAW